MIKKLIALILSITCITTNSLALDDDQQLDPGAEREEGHETVCPELRAILNQFTEQTLQNYSLDPIEAWYRGYLQISGSAMDDGIEVAQESLCEAARSVLTAPARAMRWAYFPRRHSVAAFMIRGCIMISFHFLEAYDMLPSTMAAVCARGSTVAFLFSTYFGTRLRL